MTVLADSIEKPEDIDVKRAKEAKERAEEQLVSSRVCRNTMFPKHLWQERWHV